MKNLFLFLAFIFLGYSNAQIINIPDANFKARLLQASSSLNIAFNASNARIKIDTNNDGEIQVSEALLVYQLKVPSRNIANMTGIESFTNLTFLDCSQNQITTLNVNGLTNLTNLQCYNNQLSSLDVNNSVNLQSLNCGTNQLTNIDISSLPALIFLECYGNQLTNLDMSIASQLKELDCTNNLLTGLDLSSQGLLEELYCGTNELSSITLHPSTVSTLKNLAIQNNNFSNFSFNSYPLLETLACGQNPLTSFDIINLVNLVGLNIDSLDIAYVNYLVANHANFPDLESLTLANIPLGTFTLTASQFTNLRQLNLRSCSLTQLQVSSNTLEWLFFSNNSVNSIDLTNIPSLTQFEGWNNPLNSIIFNYDAPLEYFYVGGEGFAITEMDLSEFEQLFAVSFNNSAQLQSFNVKNGISQFILTFINCPNLQYICADENEITAIQDRINTYGYTNCFVNSYCSFTPGGNFYTLQGNTKLDLDTNGCSSTDINYPNLKLNFTTGSTTSSLIANESGNYSYSVQAGTYTITPILENAIYYTITPASVTVTFPSATSPNINDFCIVPNGIYSDLEITLIPTNGARPGFNSNYKIRYKNKGLNTIPNGTVNLTFNDAVCDLISSVPTTSSTNTNELIWNFFNLTPQETREIFVTLNLNSPIENPPLNNGSILNFTTNVSGLTDINPSDNSVTLNQTVVNSYDPNDKTCLEGTVVGPEMIGQYVHYVIRFENTGTANAENIVVTDQIDATKFDLSTLVPLDSSHSFITRISPTNKVEFIFENINLPFDDANNDGYVAFKIKTKSTLAIGDTFSNTANIFFDYNAPIVTNTATTTIQTLATVDFDFNDYITLAPNPAKDILNIERKNDIEISSINIYNTLGQLVLVQTQPDATINITDLKTGNYFIKVITNLGTTVSKFIKE